MSGQGQSGSLNLSPLGMPLQIRTHGAIDPALVGHACHGWRSPIAAPSKLLSIDIHLDATLTMTDTPDIRADATSMRIVGAGVWAEADGPDGRARCAISQDYLMEPGRLRDDLLDPLVKFLLAHNGRTPVHASAFIVDGLAVVLAGPSGTGKSSLCLAADRAGFQVLAEDMVFVQHDAGFRIWGWPDCIHLLPGDAVDGIEGERWRNGRRKLAVALRSASEGALSCETARLCVLSKGTEVSLKPMASSKAVRHLDPVEPGFDLIARKVRRAIAAIAGEACWELVLSDDPSDAIRLLVGNIDRLRSETVA